MEIEVVENRMKKKWNISEAVRVNYGKEYWKMNASNEKREA